MDPIRPAPPRRSFARRAEVWTKAKSLPLARKLFAPGPARRNGTDPSGSGDGVDAAREASRILVLRADDRLGNLLLLTPFLESLRAARPHAEIGMVIGHVFAPLLSAWPWVDRWFVQDKRRHIRGPWRFPAWLASIRRGRWALAFEMSNHNTHSYYACLLALASGAPVRVGFDEPRNEAVLTGPVPPPDPNRHFSLAPLALLRAVGIEGRAAPMRCPLPVPVGASPPEGAARAGIAPGERYVVVHTGGRGTKGLPGEVWRAILTRLSTRLGNRGVHGTGGATRVVAVPDPHDREAWRSPNAPFLLAPRVGVDELARLIAGAEAFLGCDSGVMHLSVAVGTPTVALFFQSNPYHYAPLGEEHTTVLLANRHRVCADAWRERDEGMARSRLLAACEDDERAYAGTPVTSERAIDTIVSALCERVETSRGPV